MFEPNVQRLLGLIKPGEKVLDIGGWACPFNRADYVLDAQPYDTRGFYRTFGGQPSQGGDVERFTRDTWIVRDICDHTPYPFIDKSFDWVICSHTLEDVRDPLWVCHEMIRIAKRGYIEVPSRQVESSRGWEVGRLAGLSHHRWLIDIDGARQTIRFLMKFHRLNAHWRFSLPASHLRALDEASKVQWLFWEGSFSYNEVTIHGYDNMDAELERFVASVRPYPQWRLQLSAFARSLSQAGARARAKLARIRR